MQEAISAGHIDTICVGIQFPGCAQHEMLCIHPNILLPRQTDERPPWEDIDDALRGLLLQLHHLNFVLPPAKEGIAALLHPVILCPTTLPQQAPISLLAIDTNTCVESLSHCDRYRDTGSPACVCHRVPRSWYHPSPAGLAIRHVYRLFTLTLPRAQAYPHVQRGTSCNTH